MEEYIDCLKVDTNVPKYLVQIYQTSFSTLAWVICVCNEECEPLPRCSYQDKWEIETSTPGSSKFTQWKVKNNKFYDGLYEVDPIYVRDLRPSILLLPKNKVKEYIAFLSQRYRKESIICYLVVNLMLLGVKVNTNFSKDLTSLLNLLYSKLDV